MLAALADLHVASGVGPRHVAPAADHLDPAVRRGVLVARRAAAVRRRGVHRLPGARHPHDDRAVLGRVGGHRLHRRHQLRRHGPVPHLAGVAHGDHLGTARAAADHQLRAVARGARHRLARRRALPGWHRRDPGRPGRRDDPRHDLLLCVDGCRAHRSQPDRADQPVAAHRAAGDVPVDDDDARRPHAGVGAERRRAGTR